MSQVDLMHPLLRSEVVTSEEISREIVSKAMLETHNGVQVLYTQGTPYEVGYQQGVLLRDEIQDNLGYLYDQAVETFISPEFFDEAFERIRPYLPEHHLQEMHGLAHGSRMPLRVIQAIHALPEMSEWGGKKQIKANIKKQLGTSCSNLAVNGSMSKSGEMLTVRILDWGLHRISKLHRYPLIHITKYDGASNVVMNLTWAGFIGAISGMNSSGVTLGEMGYGSPPNERMSGYSMPFLLKDLLIKSVDVAAATSHLAAARGTNSYIFLISDEFDSRMYLKDAERFLDYGVNTRIVDKEEVLEPLVDTVYGGHYSARMYDLLKEHSGNIEVATLQKIIPDIAMKSNFQNVIYKPRTREIWFNIASSKSSPAFANEWRYFNFSKAIHTYNRN